MMKHTERTTTRSAARRLLKRALCLVMCVALWAGLWAPAMAGRIKTILDENADYITTVSFYDWDGTFLKKIRVCGKQSGTGMVRWSAKGGLPSVQGRTVTATGSTSGPGGGHPG